MKRDRKENQLIAAMEAAGKRLRRAVAKDPAGKEADAAHHALLEAGEALRKYQQSKGGH